MNDLIVVEKIAQWQKLKAPRVFAWRCRFMSLAFDADSIPRDSGSASYLPTALWPPKAVRSQTRCSSTLIEFRKCPHCNEWFALGGHAGESLLSQIV